MKNNQILQIVISLLCGGILLWIPLVGDFHIESALIISLIGCFWAAVRACDNQTLINGDFFEALKTGGYFLLIGLPLLIAALLTGCFSIDGLAFWLLFPLPSIFFGFSIGRLLRIWMIPYRKIFAIGILLLIGVGFLVFEFYHYPQVYFFNHVWGGWPGPIYDEMIQVKGATVFYRIITILWILLLWNVPDIGTDKSSLWIVVLCACGIALSYSYFAEAGILSPRPHLQESLGGYEKSKHFDLYYDRELYSEHEIKLLAKEHEFHLKELYQELDLGQRDTTDRMESYLYAHPWQKKALVGAKFTSYVPVWLEQDQLHIAKQQLSGSLRHELVHIVAKEFGNRLFNASWSIGLIEGLAVALEDGYSSTSTIDQMVVSQKPYPTAEELRRTFSPMGFYGGRAGVNYVTAGSFVQYLLDHYPVSNLKEAYRTADVPEAYNTDWDTLAEEWHQHLNTVDFDPIDEQVAARIFAVPSLFEQECPHLISPFEEIWDRYRFYQANRDSSDALQSIDKAVALADSALPVKAEWSYQHLMAEDPEEVLEFASPQDTSIDLQLLYADAFAMAGKRQQASIFVGNAQKLVATSPDQKPGPAIETRQDTSQWTMYRRLTYQDILPDSVNFEKALYRTKIRSLRKALDHEQWDKVLFYGQQLLRFPLQDRYFDDYSRLIHQLAFLQKNRLTQKWIDAVSKMALRKRYRQRHQQEIRWVEYITHSSKN